MSKKSNETYLTVFLLLIVAALVFILIKFEILPIRFFKTNKIQQQYFQSTTTDKPLTYIEFNRY